jgi:hypothetical protein
VRNSDVTGNDVTGGDRKSPEVTGSCITGSDRKWRTGNDLSNLPVNIQISHKNSNFPAKKIEFIAIVQIDQWERFPPNKNYRLILRTNRKTPLFFIR